ncbi:hypothetical protein ANAPH2_00658 [Anaplasma phagocytophilum]|nr:hypothetical protein ANAPH2_00142 [Anaplasma phagocytophilum]SCV63520.1 hypothetical protein ANAPH2_00658 [Anaplasma phagocytophilum]
MAEYIALMASFLVFQNMHNFKAIMVGESAFFHLHAFSESPYMLGIRCLVVVNIRGV